MTYKDIAQQRLINQRINGQKLKSPAEAVRWMGAMQAQDYGGARWAVGLRIYKGNDAAIDNAMANGSIIRTHVLRPTWHFVTPADARWMIELIAPRVKALAAPWYRKLQLDEHVIKCSNDAFANALNGGKQLERLQMTEVLQREGIVTNDNRLIHLLMRAELDQVICSGARRGKQFTYALFDDRAPVSKPLLKEEAVAELAARYFTSRGPATLQDFTWWCGLTVSDAKKGMEIVKEQLTSIKVEGKEYWIAKDQQITGGKAPIAHLLPAFDEFAVAYKDRTATVNKLYVKQARYVIFDPSVVVNNQVVGTWKRTITGDGADINLNLFGKLNAAKANAVEKAKERYIKFIRPQSR